jgi:hypothetical protein
LLATIERLEWHDALRSTEAALLREAADAQLFGDDDREGWLARAEIVFELLREREDVLSLEVSTLRERLWDIDSPSLARSRQRTNT